MLETEYILRFPIGPPGEEAVLDFGLARRLARRLYPPTVGIAVLISVGLPSTYFVLESLALRQTAAMYAQELSERLQNLVAKAPTRWKSQPQRYSQVLLDFLPNKDVVSIRVLDEAGRSITRYEYTTEEAEAWWNRLALPAAVPIVFNARVVGTVKVVVSHVSLVGATLSFIIFSAAMGVGLVLLVAAFPVRVVREMEGQIQDLVETVQRSNAELERRAAEADTLREIARATGSTLDQGELFKIIAQGAARACRVDRCTIFLLDETGEWVTPVMSQFADGTADLRMWETFKALGKLKLEAVPYLQEAVRRREPVLIPEPLADPLIPHELAELFQIKSALAVPLIHKDQATGVLGLSYVREPRQFTPEQVRLAMTLSGQVVLAMENARLVKNLRQAVDDLKAAQEQLVRGETLRAVGAMASGMAHHLNNLLAVILGRVQLLLLKIDNPEIRRSLGIVERTVLEGAEVLRRVGGFTEVQPASELAPADLNQIAREALELTRPRWQDQAQLRGISIETRLELGRIPTVTGEPAALREVLMNLLLNAVDALPQGGRITVKTWTSDGWVHCSVADTGVGMSEEVRQRALEPFFTTKGPKSTGLGLSTNYGILQRHGGELVVQSTEGRGTTVTIRLPVAPAVRAPQPALATRPSSASPLQILVIDDQVEVRDVLVEMIASLGHTVIQAAEGQEGLTLLSAGKPIDLVLTNLGMPGMNGWEVVRAVKARWPHLPVGLITGWGEEPEATPEQRKEADFVIAKPITREALRDAIARARPKPAKFTPPA